MRMVLHVSMTSSLQACVFSICAFQRRPHALTRSFPSKPATTGPVHPAAVAMVDGWLLCWHGHKYTGLVIVGNLTLMLDLRGTQV